MVRAEWRRTAENSIGFSRKSRGWMLRRNVWCSYISTSWWGSPEVLLLLLLYRLPHFRKLSTLPRFAAFDGPNLRPWCGAGTNLVNSCRISFLLSGCVAADIPIHPNPSRFHPARFLPPPAWPNLKQSYSGTSGCDQPHRSGRCGGGGDAVRVDAGRCFARGVSTGNVRGGRYVHKQGPRLQLVFFGRGGE